MEVHISGSKNEVYHCSVGGAHGHCKMRYMKRREEKYSDSENKHMGERSLGIERMKARGEAIMWGALLWYFDPKVLISCGLIRIDMI